MLSSPVMKMIYLALLNILLVHAVPYNRPRHKPFDDLEMENKEYKPLHSLLSRRSDCAIVVEIWQSLGGKTRLKPESVGYHGCCNTWYHKSDIPNIVCSGSKVKKM